MKYRAKNREFELSEEDDLLVMEIAQNIWAGDIVAKNALYFCGYNKYAEAKDICASTLYHYKNGLRGRKLRQAVRDDFGIPIIFVLQFIVVIAQIIYWIRELWNQKEIEGLNENPTRNTK